MTNNNLQFYLRYLILKCVSGFGFSTAIFLFYPSDLLGRFFLLFLVQEFYFSFYLTLLRSRAHKTHQQVSSYRICCLSIIVFICFILFNNLGVSYAESIILYLSFASFPFYASKLINLEQRDIERAVRIESNSVVISSAIFFLILSLLFLFDAADSVIAPFIFMRHFLNQIIFLTLSYVTFELRGKALVVDDKNLLATTSYVRSLDIVVLLFLLKYLFFEQQFTVMDGNNAGLNMKYFLLAYDLIAAITGLYIRKLLTSNLFEHEKKEFLISTIALVYFIVAACLVQFIDLSFVMAGTFIFSAVAVIFPVLIYATGIMAVFVRTCLALTVAFVPYFKDSITLLLAPLFIMAVILVLLNYRRSSKQCL